MSQILKLVQNRRYTWDEIKKQTNEQKFLLAMWADEVWTW